MVWTETRLVGPASTSYVHKSGLFGGITCPKSEPFGSSYSMLIPSSRYVSLSVLVVYIGTMDVNGRVEKIPMVAYVAFIRLNDLDNKTHIAQPRLRRRLLG